MFYRSSAPAAQQPGVPPVPTARRRSSLLPLLGALLLLAFVGAIALVLRGSAQEAIQTAGPTTAATAAAQATGAIATAAPSPHTPVEVQASGPVAAVQGLLAGGVRDGSAGPQGEALLATLDAARQALDRGNTTEATAQLFALQRTMLEQARAGALAPDLLRRALSGIDAIADEHRLTLPLAVSAD